MSVNLSVVKLLKQKDRDVINNYLRKIRSQFPSDRAYYDAPPILIHWCLMFYAVHFPFRFQFVEIKGSEYPAKVNLRMLLN